MIDPHFSHILIIEDRDDTYMVIEDILLNDIGVRSCVRSSDRRLILTDIDASQVGLIDLVLYDIKRPLRDDFALLPELRRHPKLIGAPVVAITANIMLEDIERTQEAGFDGFIGLPVDQQRFPDQIRRILNDQFVWEPR